MKKISVSKLFAPMRVCAEMSLYYYMLAVLTLSVEYNVSTEKGVYGVVSNMIAPWLTQLLILVGACFAIGFLIVRINNAFLRFILALLPGISFFMSTPELTVLIHAAAWVYYVIYMTVGSFDVYIDVYRRRCRLLFVLALILTCLLIIYHFGNEAWYGNTLFGGEVFGLFFFILTVFSLRGMRLSTGAPAKMRLVDAANVVALPLVLIFAFFLLRGAVPVFTWIIAKITQALNWLIHLFSPQNDESGVFIPDEDFDAVKEIEDPINLRDAREPGQSIDAGTGTNPHVRISSEAWLWILIAILVLALIYIAIRQIRGRQKGNEKAKLAHEHIERLPRETYSRRQTGESTLPTNVNKIRKAYRSYLQYIRSSGVKVFPCDTSEDVLENTSEHLKIPENAALREVYIAARYGNPDAVTSEQAEEAKHCLTVIKGKDLKGAAQ